VSYLTGRGEVSEGKEGKDCPSLVKQDRTPRVKKKGVEIHSTETKFPQNVIRIPVPVEKIESCPTPTGASPLNARESKTQRNRGSVGGGGNVGGGLTKKREKGRTGKARAFRNLLCRSRRWTNQRPTQGWGEIKTGTSWKGLAPKKKDAGKTKEEEKGKRRRAQAGQSFSPWKILLTQRRKGPGRRARGSTAGRKKKKESRKAGAKRTHLSTGSPGERAGTHGMSRNESTILERKGGEKGARVREAGKKELADHLPQLNVMSKAGNQGPRRAEERKETGRGQEKKKDTDDGQQLAFSIGTIERQLGDKKAISPDRGVRKSSEPKRERIDIRTKKWNSIWRKPKKRIELHLLESSSR